MNTRTLTGSKSVALTALTWLSLGLIGLMAGFFFTYSVSVMVGLKETSDATFIETMQWINATVRNMWFGPAYFGALLISGVTTVVAFAFGRPKVAIWIGIAFVLYAVAFTITIINSVPLNNELRDAGDVAQIADLARVRADFEEPWVRWNNIRTIASTLALVAMGGGMRQVGRSS